MKKVSWLLVALCMAIGINAQEENWYYTHETSDPGQVSFVPFERLEYVIQNTLDIERKNCPVVILRSEFPMPDIHEMWITIVDPSLPPYKGPDAETLKVYGGHQLRAEINGHAIYHQLDDLDKDGIWDELFFQTDLKPGEEKVIYIYIGENIQGWNKHYTHANIGSYCRHQMPFWESENVGWKIWFANCCDVYGKRKPLLMSQHLYMDNLDGYGVSVINHNWGSDIQSVDLTMGGGAICLFEFPEKPDSISLPRHTPVKMKKTPENSRWNAGQISDTRYAYEVIVNGPIRSIMKIKTMNWKTGNGSYDLEQYYTVYAHQSYSTCNVKYTNFFPFIPGVQMGCGIRKKPGEEQLYLDGGILVSSGPEIVRDPEMIDERADWLLPFIGKALVVKDKFKPEYQYTRFMDGQHTFRVTPDKQNRYEYAIFAAWSEGVIYNNREDFEAYVISTALELNNPVKTIFVKKERKK